jgi:hypothetical protein
MKWIRGHKVSGVRVVGAVLFVVLVFAYLSPCHEYMGHNTGSVILGYDTCDDSPCLVIKAGDHLDGPIMFCCLPYTGAVIPRIFAHSIFHPPQA